MQPKLPASHVLSMQLKTVVTVAMFISVVAVASHSSQAEVPKLVDQTEWLTGRTLDLQLRQPISASWTDSPIKSRLLNFARQQKIGIFVDRRIDTEKRISISSRDVSIEQFLWQIAEQGGLGICRLDDFFYFGPPETTATLPILWQQMKTETRKRSRDYEISWNKRGVYELDEIFSPAEQLRVLSQQHRFRVTGDKLTHDLWLAIDLPAASLDAQVAILLIGFNHWFSRSRDGKEIVVFDFPEIERGQIQIGPLENARELIQALRKNHPKCKLAVNGKTLRATGNPGELTEVRADVVRANEQPNVKVGEQRFTLTTKAARGSILATVAQQTGSKLEFDPELAAALQIHITVELTNVTLDELLRAVLDGTGGKYTLANGKLTISK